MHRLAVLATLALLVVPGALAKVGAPGFTVVVDETEKTGKPQSVVFFRVTVTNALDKPIKIWSDISSKVGRGQFITPNAIILKAAGAPEAKADIPIGVQTPYENGRLDESSRVTYRFTPRDPQTNQTLADPQELTFTVHTIGTYVPGPQLFGVFVALGLAALLLRRRATR